MAWEQRNNRRYYYRKRREGDRVVSEYVGADQLAQTSATLDTLARELRQAHRQRRHAQRALDAQIDEARDLIRALTHAILLTAGYHSHKGQWRKKRHV